MMVRNEEFVGSSNDGGCGKGEGELVVVLSGQQGR